MKMSKWTRACRTVKADETIILIACAILAANRAGTPDRTAYLAFRDRCDEIGVALPNEGYRTLLVGVACGVIHEMDRM